MMAHRLTKKMKRKSRKKKQTNHLYASPTISSPTEAKIIAKDMISDKKITASRVKELTRAMKDPDADDFVMESANVVWNTFKDPKIRKKYNIDKWDDDKIEYVMDEYTEMLEDKYWENN